MVFLISINDLKDITPIDGNVDETLFTQAVLYVQEMFVQDICGTALYQELLDQVENSTLTALNTTLINSYLQPAMRYYIMAEMVRGLAIKFTNVGIMQNNTAHSQPVTGADLTTTEDHYRNRAESMGTRASKYLCANEASYPLYRNAGTSSDTIHPKSEQFKSAMYFGKENRKWH